MGYPRMLEVRQRFDAPRVDDVAGTVAAELARIGVRGRIQLGATVAIGVGSRGITNLALVVRTLVGVLKEAGARPFVVPAMGSHGGATVEGQRAILAGYGITEDGIGAPIRASMETVDLGATDGVPIHFDRTAFEFAPVVAERLRVFQPAQAGPSNRPFVMWVREVQAFGVYSDGPTK